MTDTTLGDATVFAQDDGTGVPDGAEGYTSAAGFQLLSRYKGDGSYVGEDQSGSPTMQFANVDTTNDTVDVEAGYAYILDGNHAIQSGSQFNYDTLLPVNTPYAVILPTDVTGLGLDSSTTNDVWLAVDPSSNDTIYIRHGSGLSAPTDPSVKLGTVNSSTGATTRPNDLASATLQSLSTEQAAIADNGFRLALSSNQSVPNDTFTQIAFDSVLEDNNIDTLTLGNDEVTVNDDGFYFLNLKVEFQSVSSGTNVTTAITVDGTFGVNEESTHISNGEGIFYSGPVCIILSSGDTIQFQARQQSGGSLDINSLERRTYANVVRLG